MTVLKSAAEATRWSNYDQAVRCLLLTQLEFVLTQGTNRWEAHEIRNVRVMATWFMSGERLDFGVNQARFLNAVKLY